MGEATAAAFWAGTNSSTEANAGTMGCHEDDCIGKDPMGLCDGDAVTAATQEVFIQDHAQSVGQLDLRYSPSCKANWAKFTPFNRGGNLRSVLFDWGKLAFRNKCHPEELPSGSRKPKPWTPRG